MQKWKALKGHYQLGVYHPAYLKLDRGTLTRRYMKKELRRIPGVSILTAFAHVKHDGSLEN